MGASIPHHAAEEGRSCPYTSRSCRVLVCHLIQANNPQHKRLSVPVLHLCQLLFNCYDVPYYSQQAHMHHITTRALPEDILGPMQPRSYLDHVGMPISSDNCSCEKEIDAAIQCMQVRRRNSRARTMDMFDQDDEYKVEINCLLPGGPP